MCGIPPPASELAAHSPLAASDCGNASDIHLANLTNVQPMRIMEVGLKFRF
jgi:hypothetical protein